MRTLSFAFLIALLGTMTLQAAVFERNFLEPGDGLLTYDDVNQREWLDLMETADLNAASIIESMSEGGYLHGFHFAFQEDVAGLDASAGNYTIGEGGFDELTGLVGYYFQGSSNLIGVLEFTFGQIAVDFSDDIPVFDGTNAVLLNITPPPYPWELDDGLTLESNRQLIVDNTADHPPGTGGFRLPMLGQVYLPFLAASDNGPFWLYRNVVPEPTTLALSYAVMLAIAATRFGRRGCVRD